MLERLLAADPGYRGRRVPCGQGHEAGVHRLPGQGDRHRARGGHPHAERGITAWPASTGSPRGMPGSAWQGCPCRPGCAAMNDQAAAAGAVREGRPAAGKPGRGAADRQARRAGRRGQRPAAAAAPRSRGPGIAHHRQEHWCRCRRPRCRTSCTPAIDGTGVPVTAKETAGRDGKGEDGRARTREVKLGGVLHPGQARRQGLPGP